MAQDWGGYRVIVEEARSLDEQDTKAALIDCPLCGTVLAINTAGVRSCPMGHFRAANATKRDA